MCHPDYLAALQEYPVSPDRQHVLVELAKVKYDNGNITSSDVISINCKIVSLPKTSSIELSGKSETKTNEEWLMKVQGYLEKAKVANAMRESWELAQSIFAGISQYNGQILADNPTMPADVASAQTTFIDFPVEWNRVHEEIYVDYDNTFYINTRQPLIGASEINIELAPDGTLSKATAKTDDRTIEKLLNLFSAEAFKNLIQTATQSEESTTSLNRVNVSQTNEYSLKIEQQFIRHVLYKEFNKDDCKTPIPITEYKNVGYRREIISGLNKKAGETPTDDKAGNA